MFASARRSSAAAKLDAIERSQATVAFDLDGQLIEANENFLRLMGYRWLECFIPRKLAKMIGKPLKRARFQCVDEELAHYTRDLR